MTRTHLVTGEPTDAPAPSVYFAAAGSTVWHADCIEAMSLLERDSVDAIVTDPPYALEFMGREWDSFKPSGTAQARVAEGTDSSHPFRDGSTRIRYGRADMRAFQEWCQDWAEQALRVLKPGGHLLAFGGSRTYHRLTTGIEDAGFDIRDGIVWLYSTGFPKSRNVTAAMQAFLEHGAHGVDTIRPGVYEVTAFLRDARDRAGWSNRQIDELFGTNGMAGHWTSQASQPAVPSVRQWAELRAVLGFDDSMDELVDQLAATERPDDWGANAGGAERLARNPNPDPAGGWGSALAPAFEPIVVARKPFPGSLDNNVRRWGVGGLNIDESRIGDEVRMNAPGSTRPRVAMGDGWRDDAEPREAVGRWPKNVVLSHVPLFDDAGNIIGDACADGCVPGCAVAELDAASLVDGGVSRYFVAFRYEPKAPTAERPSIVDEQGNTVQHPTVKPLDLMRYLIRLVTPRGGGRVGTVRG